MAGRGRPNTSLTHEQMSALGLVGKDLAQAITTPPPVFPALMSKPVPLETGAARNYKILWKEDFISFLKDSPYFTHPAVESDPKAQRYSDRYVNAFTAKRDQFAGDFTWKLLPAELRPNWKRRTAATNSTAGGGGKRSKIVPRVATRLADSRTVEEKLRLLEEKETGGVGAGDAADATTSKKAAADGENDDEEGDDDELGQDEQQDEEMDDENDYGNSYFDNGDAYNEEDDNLDDGPVY